MSPEQVERKLAAIFAADVAGYSRLMGIDEVGTLRNLTAQRTVMDKLIAGHRGRIVNTAGDSVLAEFASVVDAVQCAVEVQEAIGLRVRLEKGFAVFAKCDSSSVCGPRAREAGWLRSRRGRNAIPLI